MNCGQLQPAAVVPALNARKGSFRSVRPDKPAHASAACLHLKPSVNNAADVCMGAKQATVCQRWNMWQKELGKLELAWATTHVGSLSKCTLEQSATVEKCLKLVSWRRFNVHCSRRARLL